MEEKFIEVKLNKKVLEHLGYEIKKEKKMLLYIEMVRL